MGALSLPPSVASRHLLATLLLFLLLFSAFPTNAEEVIRNYHADIDVAKSGVLTITETIKVNAEGYKIRRGIFRDFPLTFEGSDGQMHRVDFDIRRIERDGQQEDYRTESIDNGTRIYIGKEDVFLDSGEHTFKITYETGRQIRYFDRHDELFWNVTGNFWDFPIYHASATVTLPERVSPLATVFYTGPQGATEKNARVWQDGGKLGFESTAPLDRLEGMTIGIKLAKGAIDAPSDSDEQWWWLHDRMNSIIAGLGFIAVLAYFGFNWLRVGRDPMKGVIVPRWDPPADLSPALVNYVDNKGFSNGGWTAFSASMIDLAVKGLITLEDLKKSVTLKRTDAKPQARLPLGEDIIYNKVKGQTYFMIDKANGRTIQKMGEDFRSAIDREHSGKYHRFNLGVLTTGIILTVAAYLAVIVLGDFNQNMLGLLIVPAFVFVFVAAFSAVLAATALASQVMVLRIFAWIMLGFFWLGMAVMLAASAAMALSEARSPDDIFALAASGGMIVVATLFSAIMGAATPLGRQLRDGIEGLRLYLTVAEKDRMNFAGAPEMSPQHFEKLLPYAVALGVEKPWSEHFQSWLIAAGATAQAYSPAWYSGQPFDSQHLGQSVSNFSSSLSSTVSSTLPPPPKSSSSGFSSSGGGSSGSGGGGGGGGGW
ncbi:DUF2207 domain-containing protein [Rhizobium sp. KVB221]|uniref:DUF2207 domain-containing protein n=1 Tax=Rhizobium setariae TaxID=2801340 RepID=A0A936YMA9_9HYPH|nr:DUF2207 domain-containing protein [Rhizobium setariae]MBL0370759.1 DUF2207 domain-containing protein [Rhizobium setariae]